MIRRRGASTMCRVAAAAGGAGRECGGSIRYRSEDGVWRTRNISGSAAGRPCAVRAAYDESGATARCPAVGQERGSERARRPANGEYRPLGSYPEGEEIARSRRQSMVTRTAAARGGAWRGSADHPAWPRNLPCTILGIAPVEGAVQRDDGLAPMILKSSWRVWRP